MLVKLVHIGSFLYKHEFIQTVLSTNHKKLVNAIDMLNELKSNW